jgi:hypothetical protein
MKKPLIHALAAGLYIAMLVSVMGATSSLVPEDNIAMPMTMLGLFVLSAAIMGYLFLYEPFNLFMENRKQEAVIFFSRTVLFFAGCVAVFLILIFLL